MEQRISIERMEQAVNIFGSFDENIRLLEKEFNVTVTNRDGELRISGEAEDVMHAAKAVQAMLTLSSRGEALGEQNVRYIIDMVRTGKEEQISELAGDVLCISAKGRPVKPKTIGQKEYIQSVLKNTVTIGRYRQDVFGRGGGGAGVPGKAGEPHHPHPARGRGRRAAGLSSRRLAEQGGPVPPAAVRCSF